MKDLIRYHASDELIDTVTVLRLTEPGQPGGLGVVHVQIKPADTKLRWWTQPPPEVIRQWVDELLEGTGLVRDGRREQMGGGPIGSWTYRYYVTRAQKGAA